MARTILDPQKSKRVQQSIKVKYNLADTLLDSLPTNSAILDNEGIIRITNKAWRNFARLNDMDYPEAIGINYLEVTESSRGYSSDRAEEAAEGIRSLLERAKGEFLIEYPCHNANHQRWCRMRATPLNGFEPLSVVLSHEDITTEKGFALEVSALKQELRLQKANLETVNTALNVLLKRRDEDRKQLEENVVSNINEVITPYLEKLKKSNLDSYQREYLAIVQANLQGVAAPFVHHLSSKFFDFTSREIGVANLVLGGRGTKDIADVLCISPNAVEFHRKNIRKKLGIRNKKVSIRSRLLSLESNCKYQQFHACKSD